MTPRRRQYVLTSALGLSIAAIAGAAWIGQAALGSVNDTLNSGTDSVAQIGDKLALVQDATLRLVAVSQAGASRTHSTERHQVDSLSALADSVRRLLVSESSFGTKERRLLENIGLLSSQIEVRLSVAGAHRDNGDLQAAFSEEKKAARTLDTLLSETAALNSAQLRRTAGVFSQTKVEADERRRLLLGFLSVGFIGLAVTLSMRRAT